MDGSIPRSRQVSRLHRLQREAVASGQLVMQWRAEEGVHMPPQIDARTRQTTPCGKMASRK